MIQYVAHRDLLQGKTAGCTRVMLRIVDGGGGVRLPWLCSIAVNLAMIVHPDIV
jgi:hypothetical protein